jgi:voltage-gated potassium channel
MAPEWRLKRERSEISWTMSPTSRFFSTIVMIVGYAIIAVPTGIVTAEIFEAGAASRKVTTRCCPRCTGEGHDADARFCKWCGADLESVVEQA